MMKPGKAGDRTRIPPQALEAERSLLGGLMLAGRQWDEVAEVAVMDDFYSNRHQLIFRSICSLSEQNEAIDVVTTSEHLENLGQLENAGGLSYLGELANSCPGTGNLASYARIIHERAILRQLIRASNEILEMAYAPEGRTPVEVLDQAEKLIFDIAQKDGKRRTGFVSLKEALAQAVNRIEELEKSPSDVTGIPTGFIDLDRETSGLQPADLVIVAGRPSMGKTSLAMNLVEHAAISTRKPVAVFSMEMPSAQLATRMLASLGRVNAHKLRTGKMQDEDWSRLVSAMNILNEVPIFIDDTAALSPLDLRSRVRRLAREQGDLGLVVVDYLQLMQSSGSSNENRTTEISTITRSLKILAKEMNVPLVVLSQLNRSLENRPNKRPLMSDLRESGSIEQDADLILFIYRDEQYNKDSKDKGKAEVIIGKQRNGPTGTVSLAFLGEFTRFDNYASPKFAGDVSWQDPPKLQ